jgi:regulator of sigma E protease
MLIISAGVIMNVIFGIICFAIVFTIGLPYQPATVGTATPGLPAWKDGLQPGDRIVEVGGIENPWYDALVYQVMFTSPKSELALRVDRDGQEMDFAIRPVYAPGGSDKPMIGVAQSLGLELIPIQNISPADLHSAARAAKDPGFEPGDTVVAVDGQDVETYQEFNRLMFEKRRDPVTISVRRAKSESPSQRTDVRVEPAFIRTLGLRMTMGKIIAIRKDSPAAQAKELDEQGHPKPADPKKPVIRETDRIVGIEIDGKLESNFDPMELPDILASKANQPVKLKLRREAPTPDEIIVEVTPDSTPTWDDFTHPPGPTPRLIASIPSLGIAYDVINKVQSVEDGGPAAKGGVRKDDVVKEVEYVFDVSDIPQRPKQWWNPFSWSDAKPTDRVSFRCSDNSWPGIFWGYQSTDVKSMVLRVQRADGTEAAIEVVPEDDTNWPMHLRGLRFMPKFGIKTGKNLLDTILIGFDYTKVSMQRIYLTLQGLVTRQISPTLLSGPLQLATTAYKVAEDPRVFLLLIGLININLAVINFLPIPVLDGGHMVFLLYEGIFRRRPNERIVFAGHLLGFMFIILLMVGVIGLDIYKLFLERPKL